LWRLLFGDGLGEEKDEKYIFFNIVKLSGACEMVQFEAKVGKTT
jgi:hypothetical protein